MGLECYSIKLIENRSLDHRYINIRLKLLIKRLLCNIKFLVKRSNGKNINNIFSAYRRRSAAQSIIINRNGVWQLNPTYLTNSLTQANPADPIVLLALGSNITPLEQAITARIGLKGRVSLSDGFWGKRFNGASKTSALVYNIGNYIYGVIVEGVETYSSLSNEWKIFIKSEWAKLNN